MLITRPLQEEVDAFVRVANGESTWPISAADCMLAQSISQCASNAYATQSVVKYSEPCVPSQELSIRPVGRGEFGGYIISLMQRKTRFSFKILPPYSPSVKGLTWERDVLADEEVDAVYICSPDSLHQAQTIACLEQGKHVLVEKPITPSFNDVWNAYNAAAERYSENAPSLMVGFHRRFDSRFAEAKKFVHDSLNFVHRIVIESR